MPDARTRLARLISFTRRTVVVVVVARTIKLLCVRVIAR